MLSFISQILDFEQEMSRPYWVVMRNRPSPIPIELAALALVFGAALAILAFPARWDAVVSTSWYTERCFIDLPKGCCFVVFLPGLPFSDISRPHFPHKLPTKTHGVHPGRP